MAVGKVSDATFESEVLKATGPVVVDFWAEWCGPCRMIAPALEEIAGSLGEKVKIVKLNVDENPQTAAKYNIQSIPTLLIFKNGDMSSRQIGAAPKQKLEQWITAAVVSRSRWRRAVGVEHVGARQINGGDPRDHHPRARSRSRRPTSLRALSTSAHACAGMLAARARSAIAAAGIIFS